MNAWLLSIVGVVALGVLLEILLADGHTAKYIKGVFALAVVLVLVSPLPQFFNKDFDIGKFFGEEMTAQTTFLSGVNQRKNGEREEKVLNALLMQGVSADRVRVFYLHNDYQNIDVVKVYLKNETDREKVVKAVQSKLQVEDNRIKIYVT